MEDKAFSGITEVIKLKDGQEVNLPRLTIGKIIDLSDAMSELIAKAKENTPQVFELFSGTGIGKGPELVESIPKLVPVLIKQVTKVLSIYLGKDEKWVKDSMDMEDLVAVARPFLANIMQQGNHVLSPLSEMIKARADEKTS